MEKKIIVIPEGKIYDYVDGKYRNDTPEEYVRQNIEKRLVNELKYSKDRITIETSIKLGSRRPRVDIAIYDKDADSKSQENIKLIIECKKETISPSQKKDGIEQLKSYMSACLNCEWGMWTNGKQKIVLRKVFNEKGEFEFLDYNDIPGGDGKTDIIDRPKRSTLVSAVEDNLLFTFRTCHNHIYVNDGMQKQPAFFEFLKIIFCKIEDERNIPNELEFFATSTERNNPDGQLSVFNRISTIFNRVKKKHTRIFEANDKIKLQPRSLAYIVSELQKYTLLSTHIDIKGKAYEELVGANLRGDRGEFFTPRNIMDMTVRMVNPKLDEKVLDSSCGTGGFVVQALAHVISYLEISMSEMLGKEKSEWNYDELRVYQEKIEEISSNNFFGFDINPDLVKATRMNMVMNNDGSGNILRINSLLAPHEWDIEFKTKLAEYLGINKNDIRNSQTIEFFDVIVTNPPFGSKIPIKDPSILEQYDLGHIWEQSGMVWTKTSRLQGSVPPEQLFVERCLQLLKPGGRLGVVLPDAILGTPGLEYLRYWLISKAKIIASIDLHVDTFQPRNGTQTSVLILQKKTREEVLEEETNGLMADYEVFMTMVEKVGHDKRGNLVFMRDEDGNEILIPDQQNDDRVAVSYVKVIDDESIIVPDVFSKWKRKVGITW